MKTIGAVQWFKNMLAPTSNPADGAYLYAESGVMKVRQANGTIIPITAAGDPSFSFFLS